MPTVEQARETKTGPLLDAMFFETCCGWKPFGNGWLMEPGGDYVYNRDELPYTHRVSTNAMATDELAMRWARENRCDYRITYSNATLVWVKLEFLGNRNRVEVAWGCGSDWKEAFVRACIVAAIQLQAKGT